MNGKEDKVRVADVRSGDAAYTQISILHLEGTKWVEYPYNFIHNPNTSIEQPVSFEAEESWQNGDFPAVFVIKIRECSNQKSCQSHMIE